jgi:hypothetical protein
MGLMKRYIEDTVEKLCTCGEECSIEQSDHDKGCPAREFLFCPGAYANERKDN